MPTSIVTILKWKSNCNWPLECLIKFRFLCGREKGRNNRAVPNKRPLSNYHPPLSYQKYKIKSNCEIFADMQVANLLIDERIIFTDSHTVLRI